METSWEKCTYFTWNSALDSHFYVELGVELRTTAMVALGYVPGPTSTTSSYSSRKTSIPLLSVLDDHSLFSCTVEVTAWWYQMAHNFLYFWQHFNKLILSYWPVTLLCQNASLNLNTWKVLCEAVASRYHLLIPVVSINTSVSYVNHMLSLLPRG